MLSSSKSTVELQTQRSKLANSYSALYEEFSSKDLHTVGNYQLQHLIGKGSFGKVYLATHKLTNGSKVVLKSADKADANLAREIHHHRQFRHPHIARLYEVLVTESLVWLVLEYCPGDELYYYLTHNGALNPSMVQRIFAQLVGAVSYVHSKSCVHRDLKLENILLDKNQNVKLVDFGFTREYEGKSSYLQTWCGTVCYSAPEMLKGEKYAGEKVDIWSLGIILYALLCGELPFDEDDENDTKMRILKEEPVYPETMPKPAKELINLMLSKRPLLRPSLSDILTAPWLAEYAPQQQAILKLQQPPPFTTQLETETLQRLRSAGVNIDMVIENVLSQRCDSLAGWWALLLEKEERKAKRREHKRKEKEATEKANRRMSAASGRLERIAPTINESDEEGAVVHDRYREAKRTNGAAVPSLQKVPETRKVKELPRTPSTSGRRTPVHTASNARRRSQLGPANAREYNKRNSQLSVLAAANQELLANTDNSKAAAGGKKGKRRNPPFMSQIASIKHWFKESAKRAKTTNSSTNNLLHPDSAEKGRPHELQRISSEATPARTSVSQIHPDLSTRPAYQNRPRVSTKDSSTSNGSAKRHSHSLSPITPSNSTSRNSNRRSTGSNLRGRQSTSSSVSSIRSFHTGGAAGNAGGHHASHSVASSTSSHSTSLASPGSLAAPNPSTPGNGTGAPSSSSTRRISPNSLSTLKVLPRTPPNTSFPADVRFGRSPPPAPLNLGESRAAFAGTGVAPGSPGLVFAKRRRTPFRGPLAGSAGARRKSAGNGNSGSRNGSVQGRGSGEIIEEEEEEEEEEAEVVEEDAGGGEVNEEEDEYEEVDSFEPVISPDQEVIHVESIDPGILAKAEIVPPGTSASYDDSLLRSRPRRKGGGEDTGGQGGVRTFQEETLKALERPPSAPT